jgi:hypothetical protein
VTPHPDAAERRRALLETAAVAAALHAYIGLWRPTLAVDLGAVLATLVVVLVLFRRRGETCASLGIGFGPSFAAASRFLAPLAFLAAAGSCAIRAGHGPLAPEAGPVSPADLAVSLATYPLWGFLQQLFYLGFVMRGLARGGLPIGAAGALAGVAYGLVHAPNWPLVAATVPLGLAFAWVYARAPNLLAIGLVHGIAGSFVHQVAGLDLEVGARYGVE